MHPYFEWLTTQKAHTLGEASLLGELKNLCVKIILPQSIKDAPLYKKFINEEFLRRPRRNKMDDTTINVINQIVYLMLGRVITPKYLNPRSTVVYVHINEIIVLNTLIGLGAAINVITKETKFKLKLQ